MNNPVRNNSGRSIIESMVAVAIVSLAMVGLSSTQSKLTQTANDTDLRTQARQLAETQFSSLQTALLSATAPATAPLAGQTTTQTLNRNHVTQAIRQTWQAGEMVDGQGWRTAQAESRWNDNAAQPGNILIRAVVAQRSLVDEVLATNPPDETSASMASTLRQLQRIPVSLITGTSKTSAVGYKLSSPWVLLDGTPNSSWRLCQMADNAAINTEQCITTHVMFVAGFVQLSSTYWGDIKSNITRLNPVVDATDIARSGATLTCQISTATNALNGQALSGTYQYLCVIVPDASVRTWSGMLRFTGFAASGASVAICRYEADPPVSDNPANRQPYKAVNESLWNQNYRVVSVSGAASASTPDPCQSENPVNSTPASRLVLHQDCRTAAGAASNTCI